jgi:ribosomal protein S18 acetylase RimI-like enzyme
VTVAIARLDAEQATQVLPDLIALLRDAVDGGASIGFLPPLSAQEAEAYWREVIDALKKPYRIMLIARSDGAVAGTVQLNLESRANGRHRAEVMKLIVHSAQRRRGIAQALMQAIEAEARKAKRTTLVLDTRAGDAAEPLYLKLSWIAAGKIPRYAANADGSVDPTVIMYKLLE